MITTTLNGRLEIDHERGVIYFHSEDGTTSLRICRLPVPIPQFGKESEMLDITHMHGTSWRGAEIVKDIQDELQSEFEKMWQRVRDMNDAELRQAWHALGNYDTSLYYAPDIPTDDLAPTIYIEMNRRRLDIFAPPES